MSLWWQLFKGTFFHCEGPDLTDVETKSDCLSKGQGYRWINQKYNFDNLGQVSVTFLVYVYSKQPILGLTQVWFRELSFSRLECGVHDKLHIYTLGGIFYFPCHRHQIERTEGI